MDTERVTALCAEYTHLICATTGLCSPKKLPEVFVGDRFEDIPYLARYRHLLFVAEEIPRLMAQGRTEKAMRWLGWLQGVLWSVGFETLHDAKLRNAPDGATYNSEA